ncbi:MAG: glucose-1-phosphate adenylyltransferase [Planctomycetales bacterium]|nr:glucose-1-phosphate adenylyltransferase [Planctomycetales bacterium]NIM08323.1 glucose-1-phosphate adenylyltransferase [Planctomycetales bacterium]NIN07798.1 glucose-1-phosphate adenylyltransferase [Planctomycetales bacterium]NIN76929.1 glucose-1-phosphate adenylyltransferase [Planctomycetales bacterium]NIO34116.1 glucose-1-phosphate adenylyltransferase [Planctomycetales bacterium]
MKNILTVVLGGGRGTRLFPLTRYRSKPAVPLAGRYRLIDIPISNCINSGLRQIYVLTQFMSVSLHRHIRQSYQFDRFSGGYVEILAAQQTLEDSNWYQGTADAVRQNIRYIKQHGVDYVLILSGDQLYRMDFRDMLTTHQQAGAEATIAAMPVAREEASGLGIMRLDDSGRVIGFLEKPQTQEEMDTVRMDPAWIEAHGVQSRGRDLLASMGIYLFNRDFLVDALEKTDYRDFGKEIFPASIRARHVHVHLFDGYWEDIGTIGSFYRCNLELAGAASPFKFISPGSPIYSRSRYLPPARIDGARIQNSLVADGCIIEEGATIENSVIGLRCQIGKQAVIRNSVLMGADFYESPAELARDASEGRPPLGIGREAKIEGAIIDKNCHIGSHVRVVNESNAEEANLSDQVFIRDGVVVVEKDTTLSDGWKI